MEDSGETNKDETYAKAVRAGKRTYFFDIRSTKNNEFYLTITESKKRFNDDGTASYMKHKIFLYKEDFEKFGDALNETFDKITELNKTIDQVEDEPKRDPLSDFDFEDLGGDR